MCDRVCTKCIVHLVTAGVIGDVPIAHHSDITTLPGEEGEEEEEDIVCVMKRQLKEANDLLAKCGEALRLVYTCMKGPYYIYTIP